MTNRVRGAQLEPERKQKDKGASVCHSRRGKKDVGQTATERVFRSLVGGDEIDDVRPP